MNAMRRSRPPRPPRKSATFIFYLFVCYALPFVMHWSLVMWYFLSVPLKYLQGTCSDFGTPSVWICRHGDVTPVKMLTVGFSPGRPIKPLPGPVGFHTRLSIPLPQSPASPLGENCIFLSLKKNMQMRECRLEASPHPVFPSHPSVGFFFFKERGWNAPPSSFTLPHLHFLFTSRHTNRVLEGMLA